MQKRMHSVGASCFSTWVGEVRLDFGVSQVLLQAGPFSTTNVWVELNWVVLIGQASGIPNNPATQLDLVRGWAAQGEVRSGDVSRSSSLNGGVTLLSFKSSNSSSEAC